MVGLPLSAPYQISVNKTFEKIIFAIKAITVTYHVYGQRSFLGFLQVKHKMRKSKRYLFTHLIDPIHSPCFGSNSVFIGFFHFVEIKHPISLWRHKRLGISKDIRLIISQLDFEIQVLTGQNDELIQLEQCPGLVVDGDVDGVLTWLWLVAKWIWI